jgi:hypothetical protein
MSEIKITDIQNLTPAGSDFFADDESFITELSEDDMPVWGGTSSIGSLSLGVSGQTKVSAQTKGSLGLSLSGVSG